MTPDLALVVPVWNDQAALSRLLSQAQGLGVFAQVVVVDDGSDVPVTVPQDVTLIRHETPQTAGAARNTGLAAVTASHVLFFDSDDLLTRELQHLWQDVQGEAFDLCLFRHADSRRTRKGGWEQMPYDDALWRAAGALGHALTHCGARATATLAQTANYPWNRLYRAAFLREYDIRYPALAVHNDIEPHWMALLQAETVLASDRVCAVHHVAAGRGRLTNRQGGDRLEVFTSLDRVARALAEAPDAKAGLYTAFLRFVSDLMDWIRGALDARWHNDLTAARHAFLREALPPARSETLICEDPVLALKLALQMGPRPC